MEVKICKCGGEDLRCIADGYYQCAVCKRINQYTEVRELTEEEDGRDN